MEIISFVHLKLQNYIIQTLEELSIHKNQPIQKQIPLQFEKCFHDIFSNVVEKFR